MKQLLYGAIMLEIAISAQILGVKAACATTIDASQEGVASLGGIL